MSSQCPLPPAHRLAALLGVVALLAAGACSSPPPAPSQSVGGPASSAPPGSSAAPPSSTSSTPSPAAVVPIGKAYTYPDGLSIQVTGIAHRVLTEGDHYDPDSEAKPGDAWTVVTLTTTNGTSSKWEALTQSSLRHGGQRTLASRVYVEDEITFLDPGEKWEYDTGYVLPAENRGNVVLEVKIDTTHPAIAFTGSIEKERA